MPPECCLPHVGLHLWILYPDSLDVSYQCPLNAVGPLFVNPAHTADTSLSRDFYLQCVQAPYGAGGDALARKLASELRGGPSSVEKLANLILPTLSWLAVGVQAPFIPAASSHGLLRELIRNVEMLAQMGGEHTRTLVLSQKIAMQLAR